VGFEVSDESLFNFMFIYGFIEILYRRFLYKNWEANFNMVLCSVNL
jgi:hypothetical protein